MRKIHRIMLLSLVVLTAAGLVSSQALAGKDDKAQTEAHKLADAVAAKIHSLPDYGAFDWVNIYVAGHTVTFVGEVARERLKSDITDETKKIKGVEKVNNNLRWLGKNPRNQKVRVGVYQAIYTRYFPDYSQFTQFDRAIGSTKSHSGNHPIHIVVSDGHVTLMGYVFSNGDKAKATEAAKTVMGVEDVVNSLVVVHKHKE